MARRRCSTRLGRLGPGGSDDGHHVVGVVAARLLVERPLDVPERGVRVAGAQRHRCRIDALGGRLRAGGPLGGLAFADAEVEAGALDELALLGIALRGPGGTTRRRRRSRGAAARGRRSRRWRLPRKSSVSWAAAAETARSGRGGDDRPDAGLAPASAWRPTPSAAAWRPASPAACRGGRFGSASRPAWRRASRRASRLTGGRADAGCVFCHRFAVRRRFAGRAAAARRCLDGAFPGLTSG